ncbi:MAG: hypothetical protein ACD_49C00029G0027 [uncultured bacterium (gcode 4)]|uniref:Uncharacterized protein n=1 Tax=uncultured bacterium (gcode 4) TaxID=1234023 RepID=K2BWI7_9BACT|nr:MAG: hypothetical protein ACD_49C00029G0027 [uncultured bacterium (gcode 4)]
MVKLDLGALQKINNTAILSEETPVSTPTVENITPVENTDLTPQKPKISLSKLMWLPDVPETNPIVEAEKIPEIKLEIEETQIEIISESPNVGEILIPKIEEANFVLTEKQEEALIEEEIAEEVAEANSGSESLFIQEEKKEEKEEEIVNLTWKEFFPNFDLGKEFNLFDDEEEKANVSATTNPVETEIPNTQIINSQEEIAVTDISTAIEENNNVINPEKEEAIPVLDLTETKAETEEIINLNNATETAEVQEIAENEPLPDTQDYVNKVKTDLSAKRLLGWIKSFNKKVVISALSVVLLWIWIFGFFNIWNLGKINIFENGNTDTPPVLTNSWSNYVEWVDYFIVTTRKSNPKAKKATANTWALDNTWTTNTETPEIALSWSLNTDSPETTSSWEIISTWAININQAPDDTVVITPDIQ